MNNKPPFDRSILIPIGIGFFSLIGICFILVGGRIFASRATVEDIPTTASFHFVLIGTEPAVVTSTLEEAITEAPPAATEAPIQAPTEAPTALITPNNTIAPTLPILRTNTPSAGVTSVPPSRTPTSASTAPLGAGTFDNVDSRMVYTGDWTRQSGVPGAYQNTLSVSITLQNSVFFRFIGQELRVFFQAGPSLGTIRLRLDGSNYDMSQASNTTQSYEWVLPTVPNNTHEVLITHLSGGSVNLDYIIVTQVEPTATSTATSNP